MTTEELSIVGYCCTGSAVMRAPTDEHDHQVDDDREHGVLDEDIGE